MGNDIVIGGTMIIPSDIKIEATMMSITKKGSKITKPIWKAIFNSLNIKAGINLIGVIPVLSIGNGVFDNS